MKNLGSARRMMVLSTRPAFPEVASEREFLPRVAPDSRGAQPEEQALHGTPLKLDMIAKNMRFWSLIPCAMMALHGAAAPAVDFARDVRPILSDRCFACHGPDEASRKAGLRLDTEDGAKKARGPHTPIIP